MHGILARDLLRKKSRFSKELVIVHLQRIRGFATYSIFFSRKLLRLRSLNDIMDKCHKFYEIEAFSLLLRCATEFLMLPKGDRDTVGNPKK
jgi:hypothetical protein